MEEGRGGIFVMGIRSYESSFVSVVVLINLCLVRSLKCDLTRACATF
jgi:hypothetical protein